MSPRLGSVLLLGLTLTACEPATNQGVVARVGDWTLGRRELADFLVLAQPMPLDSATVGGLVDQWVSMAALAIRLSSGSDLMEPDAVDASLWLEKREAVLKAERRTRLDAAVSPEQAAAAFQADTFLLIAQVLRRTGPFTSVAERDLQRRTAQSILDGLLAGGSWDRAVARSEDDETRGEAGLLGLVRLDEVPPALRSAVASLRPGQVTSVVESPQGFHILYRPRFEDVSTLYVRLLSDRLLAEADSVANRDLLDTLNVHLSKGGLEAVRRLAGTTHRRLGGTEPLVLWDGGALGEGVVARYLTALPREAQDRLARSSNAELTSFLRQLAAREVRLQAARADGLAVDSATLEDLQDLHRRDVEGWKTALREGSGSYSRGALDAYMGRLVARQIPLHPLPPLFRAWLLEPLKWSEDPRAVAGAIDAARRLIAAADSTGVGSGGPR